MIDNPSRQPSFDPSLPMWALPLCHVINNEAKTTPAILSDIPSMPSFACYNRLVTQMPSLLEVHPFAPRNAAARPPPTP